MFGRRRGWACRLCLIFCRLSAVGIIEAVGHILKAQRFVKAFDFCALVGIAGAAVGVFDAGNGEGHGLDGFILSVVDGCCVRLAVNRGLKVVGADVRPVRLFCLGCVLPRRVRHVRGGSRCRPARCGACRWRGNVGGLAFCFGRLGVDGFFKLAPKAIKRPSAVDEKQEEDGDEVKHFATGGFDFGMFFGRFVEAVDTFVEFVDADKGVFDIGA